MIGNIVINGRYQGERCPHGHASMRECTHAWYDGGDDAWCGTAADSLPDGQRVWLDSERGDPYAVCCRMCRNWSEWERIAGRRLMVDASRFTVTTINAPSGRKFRASCANCEHVMTAPGSDDDFQRHMPREHHGEYRPADSSDLMAFMLMHDELHTGAVR